MMYDFTKHYTYLNAYLLIVLRDEIGYI